MNTEQIVNLTKKERTVLTDAVRWVLENEEESLNEQQIDALNVCLEEAENEMVIDRKEVPPQTISLVFRLFSSEVQTVVSDMEESESIFEFYEDVFTSVDEKLSYSEAF